MARTWPVGPLVAQPRRSTRPPAARAPRARRGHATVGAAGLLPASLFLPVVGAAPALRSSEELRARSFRALVNTERACRRAHRAGNQRSPSGTYSRSPTPVYHWRGREIY